MYGFTYDDKLSPNSSQEDSRKAHTYQLVPVPFHLFLKPNTAFPLIDQRKKPLEYCTVSGSVCHARIAQISKRTSDIL